MLRISKESLAAQSLRATDSVVAARQDGRTASHEYCAVHLTSDTCTLLVAVAIILHLLWCLCHSSRRGYAHVVVVYYNGRAADSCLRQLIILSKVSIGFIGLIQQLELSMLGLSAASHKTNSIHSKK
jgi:hypothetical protein